MTDQERLKLSILHMVVKDRASGAESDTMILVSCQKLYEWVKDTPALPKIEAGNAVNPLRAAGLTSTGVHDG